jgi:hypothetical protein
MANDGAFCRNEQSVVMYFHDRPCRFASGTSLAERRPLMRSVKGNKALLLTKVTKP